MATQPKGNVLAPKGNGSMSYDYGQRAALAINNCVPGPHRDKVVARLLDCSVRFAKYLRAGQGWTIEWLNRASERIENFDAYVADPLLARCDALEREIADIRSIIRREANGR